MNIIEINVDDSTDRMYCPSTEEVIFSPDMKEVNEDADAFIGYWHNEILDQPEIKDPKLLDSWEKYFESWDELMEDMDPSEIVENFLRNYQNEQWAVYQSRLTSMACGPVATTVYMVVKADTIVEKDWGNKD